MWDDNEQIWGMVWQFYAPNNFIVYGQKQKCGYMFSLLEQAEHFETKKSRLGEIFSFEANTRHLQHLQLTLKAPTTTAAEDKFCNSFPSFQQK